MERTDQLVRPVVLGPNQPPERFYRGGAKIARFRGEAPPRPHTPEDWVGSVTTVFGESTLGRSWIPRGGWLADAVTRDPVSWLGTDHWDRFGDDPMLLVKLLDAGQRLPVHSHPDAAFAKRHLGHGHGKAEAWVILDGGTVHLGFADRVERTTLDRWVRDQDTDAMLAAMNTIEVQSGDTVFVPAGLPHAIGAGVFLIELQEPEDLSVLMEWTGFAIDGTSQGHLGLGFDVALDCVDRDGTPPTRIHQLVRRNAMASDGSVLTPEADVYFRAEFIQVDGRTTAEPGYSVFVVVAGNGSLTVDGYPVIPLRNGSTVLLPHAAGSAALSGRMDILRCRPPAGA
ncbi:class I mannose-6-phosphate isomerase [Streptomyces aculeolatus]